MKFESWRNTKMFSEEDSSLSMFNCEDVISNVLERNTCSNSWREIHKVFSPPFLLSASEFSSSSSIFSWTKDEARQGGMRKQEREKEKKGTRGLIIFLSGFRLKRIRLI